MKKLFITLIGLMLVVAVYAQPKGSATKAKALLDKGDIAGAKTEIDNAIAGEAAKLQSKGKEVKIKSNTLYNKGLIYSAIATSDDATVNALSANALSEAVAAYNEVLTTEKETSVEYQLTQPAKNDLYGKLYNKAVEYYNQEDMKGAVEYFEKVTIVNPQDTTVLANIVQLAYSEGNESEDVAVKENMKNKVIENAKKLFAVNFTKPYLYRMVANYDRTIANNLFNEGKKDEAKPYYEKALAVLLEGQKTNPADGDIAADIIFIYAQTEKTQEAINSLNSAIINTPNDKILYFNRALLFEKVGKTEEALKDYEKAIELDPKYKDAYYSLGAFYYNKAAEVSKLINALDIDGKTGEYKDKKKAQELESELKKQFEKSLPYLEKNFELDSEDQSIISLLARIYNTLGKKAEYEKMSKLIKE
jgi:tetratricopeptide (TPR) repeat protein